MQILNFLITSLVCLAVGVVLFFFLLLAFNGYSEDQAMPGLILYVVWVLLFSFGAAALSILAAKYLIGKKSFSPIAAVAVAAPLFIVVGGVMNVLGTFAAAILSEALR